MLTRTHPENGCEHALLECPNCGGTRFEAILTPAADSEHVDVELAKAELEMQVIPAVTPGSLLCVACDTTTCLAVYATLVDDCVRALATLHHLALHGEFFNALEQVDQQVFDGEVRQRLQQIIDEGNA